MIQYTPESASFHDAYDFLRTIFAPYPDSPDLRCEIRALHPVWRTNLESRPPRAWFPLTPVALDAAAKTSLLWSRAFDVYVGVLPRVGQKGGAADVRIGGWLWCDIDGGAGGFDAAKALFDSCGLPKPQMAVKSGGGMHCVPLDSEILTAQGWKTWDRVGVGDVVMGYDTASESLRWTRMTGKVVKTTDNVVRLSNSYFSVRCTPQHRWVCHIKEGHQRAREVRNRFAETQDISRRRHKIITSAPFDTEGILPVTERECALLGWILADGSVNGELDCSISQKNGPLADEIRELVAGISISEKYNHRNSGCPEMVTWRFPRAWVRELWGRLGVAGSKHECSWESVVLGMSSLCRRAFLDAFWKADGTYNRGTKIFIQNPGRINDAVRLAVFLEGKTPRTSYGRGGIAVTRPGSGFVTWDLKVEPDVPVPVWCPQTETGTWVMRQGDTITITGNCYWRLRATVETPDQSARLRYKAMLRRIVLGVSANGNNSGILKEGEKKESITDPAHSAKDGRHDDAHADESAAEVARILRVPGTFNLKRQHEPRAVEIVHFDPDSHCYDMDAWDGCLPDLPAPPEPRRDYTERDYDPSSPIPDGLIRWARTGYGEGKRHKDLVSAAAWLKRDVKVPDHIAEELVGMKARASVGTRNITDEEIRSIVRWA